MKRILCTIAAMIAAFFSSCGRSVSTDTLTVSFIDVGKGDCILAECGGNALLIDTGYEETAQTVLGYLSERGIEKLDCMIITHYDKDHVGGAAVIAESIPVERILLPGYEGDSKYHTLLMNVIRQKEIASEKVSRITNISAGSAGFTVYPSDIEYSSDGKEGNDNDVSLVISAQHEKDSYLFAGDIEKAGIKSFLKKNDRTYDVLKMPHHGRKESNTDDLIEAAAPKIAVITDSAGDPADKKVISLLDRTKLLRSSECGNIVIESSGDAKYRTQTAK